MIPLVAPMIRTCTIMCIPHLRHLDPVEAHGHKVAVFAGAWMMCNGAPLSHPPTIMLAAMIAHAGARERRHSNMPLNAQQASQTDQARLTSPHSALPSRLVLRSFIAHPLCWTLARPSGLHSQRNACSHQVHLGAVSYETCTTVQ